MSDRKSKKIISGIIIFLFLTVSLFHFFPSSLAQTTTTPQIPTLMPYVNDYAGVLSQDQIESINALCAQIEQNTTAQIAVLIVNTTQPQSIDQYANTVFRANGIGQSDVNNGLLLVVATGDRTWRFEVGYGLEPDLPDALVGQIGLTYLVPNLQNGTYGNGIYLAVQQIGDILSTSNDASIVSNQTSYGSYDTVDLLSSLFPFIIILAVPLLILATNDISRCPKCGAITFEKKSESTNDTTVFVCKKGHRWTKKRRKNTFLWFFGILGGFGGGRGGRGGGGFGGGSSGGGGASGGF